VKPYEYIHDMWQRFILPINSDSNRAFHFVNKYNMIEIVWYVDFEIELIIGISASSLATPSSLVEMYSHF
jgi:hypothetical protein